MRRRRAGVLVALLLALAAYGVYKAVTWVPREVSRMALAAVQEGVTSGAQEGDEWRADCDDTPVDETYVCVVTWKQVDRAYADSPADYCEDFVVVVAEGRTERKDPLRRDGPPRGC